MGLAAFNRMRRRQAELEAEKAKLEAENEDPETEDPENEDPENEDPENEDPEVNYDELSYDDLQAMAKERGIPANVKKVELIEALKASE
jgi:hypothetical protein